MKRGWLTWLIAGILAFVLLLVLVYPQSMLAPGALAPAHSGLAGDCFACHAPMRGASPQRCLACHALADIGLRTTQGVPIARPFIKASFHQRLIESNCMACHAEHEAADPARRNRKPFSHDLLRLDVRDRCETCHAGPPDALHRRIDGGCSKCHRAQAWKPSSFDHARLFELDRNHDGECAICHRAQEAGFGRYTCYGCHEHTPAGMRATHEQEGITKLDDCVRCHRSASGEPGHGD